MHTLFGWDRCVLSQTDIFPSFFLEKRFSGNCIKQWWGIPLSIQWCVALRPHSPHPSVARPSLVFVDGFLFPSLFVWSWSFSSTLFPLTIVRWKLYHLKNGRWSQSYFETSSRLPNCLQQSQDHLDAWYVKSMAFRAVVFLFPYPSFLFSRWPSRRSVHLEAPQGCQVRWLWPCVAWSKYFWFF